MFRPGTTSPLKQILQNCYMKRLLQTHVCTAPIYFSPPQPTGLPIQAKPPL